MGQLVGGNTSLEFYKQLETINNELDSINSELTSQAESISSLNSSIPAPDYKNKQVIAEDGYTAPSDGYVRLYNYLGNTQVPEGTSVQSQVTINGETVYNFSLYLVSSDMYISCDSGLIPVKKGDYIIFGHLGNDNADRLFYPVRH